MTRAQRCSACRSSESNTGGGRWGLARAGHDELELIHTNGSMPVTSFYPIQANRVGSLGSAVEPCPEWHLCHQWNIVCQAMHERRSHPPPRGVAIRDQVATRCNTTQGQAWNQGLVPHDGQTVHHILTNCQLSVRGTCIRGRGLHECTTHCTEWTKPCRP